MTFGALFVVGANPSASSGKKEDIRGLFQVGAPLVGARSSGEDQIGHPQGAPLPTLRFLPLYQRGNVGDFAVVLKSGFTQRRDDATKGNKGIGLMFSQEL
jgi:hypothetical protein